MYDRARPQLPTPASYVDTPSPVGRDAPPRVASAASLERGTAVSPPSRSMGARRVSLRRPPSNLTVGRSAQSPKASGRTDAVNGLGSPLAFASDVVSVVEPGLPGVITRHHHRVHSVIDSCIQASKEDGTSSVGAASATARLMRRASYSTQDTGASNE